MHQQFEYAPFGPKRRSRSRQRSGVTGWISSRMNVRASLPRKREPTILGRLVLGSGIDREAGAERFHFAGDVLEVGALVRVVEHIGDEVREFLGLNAAKAARRDRRTADADAARYRG